MIVGINELFDMLFSDDEQVQKKGVEEGKKVKYLSIFILPGERNGKAIWESCAEILSSKNDEELEPYLPSLFDWFRDGNWPGFMTICERLRKMPAHVIVEAYEYIINDAQRIGKDESEMWLTYLAGLIRNQELLELLPKEQQKLMKKYYTKMWIDWDEE